MDNFTVKRLRDRAAECRAFADVVQNEPARDQYLHAAEMYETTAAQLEALETRPNGEPIASHPP